jgi:hypothetical protein
MENWNKIQEAITAGQDDAEKFYVKGNSAAGTRLRKSYKEIMDACKAGRKEVSDLKTAQKAQKVK